MKKTFDDLYKAFEDRFRGSRELIKDRLKIYQPLLAQVPRQAEGPTLAIDLGCGRGEWLEILAEAGFDATGVDLNGGMAQEAVERGLKIELHDALEYLKRQPDCSAVVISAFHMVEHVPTEYLIELLDECHRVMAKDGLLVLETPNPENISVGTHTFHLDPTHKSPLPPDLLEFLVEEAGFPDTAILRLNGSPMIEAGPIERSVHLMFEVARDYACLARKSEKQSAEASDSLAAFVQSTSQKIPADVKEIKGWLRSADNEITSISEEVKAATDSIEEIKGWLRSADNDIISISEKVEAATTSSTDQFRQLSDNLSTQSELLRTGNIALTNTVASLGKQLKEIVKDRAVAARDNEIGRLRQHIAGGEVANQEQLTLKEAETEERNAEIALLNERITAQAEQVASLARQLEGAVAEREYLRNQVLEIYQSRSWKLAGPYRRTGRVLKRFAASTPDLRIWTKHKTRPIYSGIIRFVLLRPRLKTFLSSIIRRYPKIHNFSHGLIASANNETGAFEAGALSAKKEYTLDDISRPFSTPTSFLPNNKSESGSTLLSTSQANRILLNLRRPSRKKD
ncbi:class I SAM-dependent methyltransferase [Mesorhizobium sp. NZP2298]|uniref:class I SAM-dependent methyltransferase n=1 Tax=Mesorhizobium sp. NZP2298 TaxID=2483403 RepID=UPI00155731E7|nr:class I SAM-dependent methyltransferase [Mesorhizobium sp. NZP2298]QKC97776.1 methyltransferase domain-containing protein [Mesorhizobium sp. NZP2298]